MVRERWILFALVVSLCTSALHAQVRYDFENYAAGTPASSIQDGVLRMLDPAAKWSVEDVSSMGLGRATGKALVAHNFSLEKLTLVTASGADEWSAVTFDVYVGAPERCIGVTLFQAAGQFGAWHYRNLCNSGTQRVNMTDQGSEFPFSKIEFNSPLNPSSRPAYSVVVIDNVTIYSNGQQPPLELTPSSGALPEGLFYRDYTTRVTGFGGKPPYTFTLSGAPSCLSIDQNGTIRGKCAPPQSGFTFAFEVQLADGNGARASAPYTITMRFPSLIVRQVSPSRVKSGQMITISGEGWPSGTMLATEHVTTNGGTTHRRRSVRAPEPAPDPRTVTVTVGGIPATEVHVVDDATITAVVPSLADGYQTVTVTTGDGRRSTLANAVEVVSPKLVTRLWAGGYNETGSADGPGSTARFKTIGDIAIDRAGNIYVADSGNSVVRKITPAGVVSTFAGLAGTAGDDDGTGSAARLGGVASIAVDAAGNVYVSGYSRTVRRITPDGVVTTIAGTPGAFGSRDGHGAAAAFSYPAGMVVDRDGNVLLADGSLIRKITPDGEVTTFAGKWNTRAAVDGPIAQAQFNSIAKMAIDAAGNIYLTEQGSASGGTVRRIGIDGMVTTLGANVTPNRTAGIAVDSHGDVYVTGYSAIYRIAGGQAQTVNSMSSPQALHMPVAMVINADRVFYIADDLHMIVRGAFE